MPQADRNIKNISIDQLAFDSQNPRLPTSFGSQVNDESTIVTWLVDNANLLDLLESITSQGFFDGEPILGYEVDGKYIVVEGNRRLAAVKLFNDPSLSKTKLKKVAEIIDSANLELTSIPFIEYKGRQPILDYLGYRHITGVQTWGALAKAKYLSQMRAKLIKEQPTLSGQLNDQFKKLAREIGTKANYVGRLLTGLHLYEVIEDKDFFGLSEINETSFNFSLLTTALSYSSISEYVGLDSPQDVEALSLDPTRLRDLIFWIYKENDAGKTRLEDSRNLSQLSKVVGSQDALAKFASGEMKLSEAVLLTDHPDEVLQNTIAQVVSSLKIALVYASHIDDPSEHLLEELKESSQHIKSIYTVLKSKQKNDELEAL